MEALRASYGDSDSSASSDSGTYPPESRDCGHSSDPIPSSHALPPPPVALLNSPGSLSYYKSGHETRMRSFPHVEGNYALHVFIPVVIPPAKRRELLPFMRRVASLVPDLYIVDADILLSDLSKNDQKLEQVALGRQFHISLGRTVPIRRHQIDSIVAMLRQKLQSQKRYWIDFSKWQVFVNDDQTRSFLSMEVTAGGLSDITRQIQIVNDVYRLHNLPGFYKDPRPHISLLWATGNVSNSLSTAIEELKRSNNIAASANEDIFTCKFGGIECKIGNKSSKICRVQDP